MNHRHAAWAVACILATSLAHGQDVKRTPLPKDHPLIGTWRIDVPNTSCFELYSIKQDGTSDVTSGEEQATSEFTISPSPSPKGFYRWVDKIVKDNGKKDCSGELMQVGHVATNYIALHRTGKMFLMCEKEDLETCIGPFTRQEGI
jgi:hypothetical protein